MIFNKYELSLSRLKVLLRPGTELNDGRIFDVFLHPLWGNNHKETSFHEGLK